MIAPYLISDSIPPVHLDDSGEEILAEMREYNVGQLPVVEGKKYVGIVMMEELVGLKKLSNSLKSFQLTLRKPFVQSKSHIFDVLRMALEANVRIVPVVDEEQHYMGLISAESCLRAFAVLNSVKDPGAIIELEVPLKDYSLAEIARITEDNEIKILCFYTNIDQQSMTAQITIKVNTVEIQPLIATFERFEYEVKGVYNDSEYTEELKDRYDALMRYLNV